jgi:hypothetical protein
MHALTRGLQQLLGTSAIRCAAGRRTVPTTTRPDLDGSGASWSSSVSDDDVVANMTASLIQRPPG